MYSPDQLMIVWCLILVDQWEDSVNERWSYIMSNTGWPIRG